MADAPSQSQDKFIVRLPDGMRDRIKAAADGNNRSMNAEIVATLEEAYPAKLSLLDQATLEWLAENIPKKKLDEVLDDLVEWRRNNEVQELLEVVDHRPLPSGK